MLNISYKEKMNFVQPIRKIEDIESMKIELKKNGTRDYLLFVMGINVGLRISDLINLKVSDVINENGTIKTHINVMEEKTNKVKRFPLNSTLTKELVEYIQAMNYNDYLFQSRNKENGQQKPLSRFQAYRILNEAGKKIGLEEIGTHTLRKTFGFHFYQRTKDIALLQEIFNHSSPSITLRYIRNKPKCNR